MDITDTIRPKSDQLNADDLIAGPMTITITSVSKGTPEQPVTMNYDGDNGRPYKPSKSMRRVIAGAWGVDSKLYIGRSMTLFRDPSVRYAGAEVGGIRISHMTDIKNDMKIALTIARGKREPYTVKPLEGIVKRDYQFEGDRAASQGVESLKAWWQALPKSAQTQYKTKLDGEWKTKALAVDAAKTTNDDQEVFG